MHLLLPLLLLLQASPEQKEVARRLFAEGEIAYNRGEYPLAEAKFRAAAQADPELPGPARMLGLALRAQHRCTDAVPAFQQYLKLAPQGKFAPAVRQQIELCRRELGLPAIVSPPRPGTGTLVVVTSLDGVVIKVDDLQRGVTPIEPLPVAPGKHTVLLYRPCYVPRSETIDVQEGQVTDLKVELSPDRRAGAECETTRTGQPRTMSDHAQVRLQTNAAGAWVAIDGQPVTLSPDLTFEAPPGIHAVEVAAPGYEPWTGRMVLMRGQERTLEVRLRTQHERILLRRWAWVALGVAAAAGAAGAAYGVAESRDFADARRLADAERNRCVGGTNCSGTPIVTRDQLAAMNDDARSERTLSLALLGTSLAAVGAGVVLFVMERGDAPDADERPYRLPGRAGLSIAPALVPAGAGVSVARSF
jgi:hypothetical protein